MVGLGLVIVAWDRRLPMCLLDGTNLYSPMILAHSYKSGPSHADIAHEKSADAQRLSMNVILELGCLDQLGIEQQQLNG